MLARTEALCRAARDDFMRGGGVAEIQGAVFKMENPRQVLFYALGEGGLENPDGTPSRSWPYEVAYAPHERPREFYLAEGDAKHGNGGFFSPAALLSATWRPHLEKTHTLWLLPILERMAGDDDVSLTEILDAYRREHGVDAVVSERTLYGG